MQITALLTGRGNNTMKDKNVRQINGKPLLYYGASAAKRSKYITNFFCSSDDDKILSAAANIGYTPIKRPLEYAQPTSQHVDAIKHALSVMQNEYGLKTDIIVVLLANTVTIKTSWIDACIEKLLQDPTLSAAVPVYQEQSLHPVRAKKLNEEGLLIPHFKPEEMPRSSNRQDLCDNYFLCHNFWVLNVKQSVFEPNGQPPFTFMGNRIAPYVVDEAFDVHDEDDLIRCEKWIERNKE